MWCTFQWSSVVGRCVLQTSPSSSMEHLQSILHSNGIFSLTPVMQHQTPEFMKTLLPSHHTISHQSKPRFQSWRATLRKLKTFLHTSGDKSLHHSDSHSSSGQLVRHHAPCPASYHLRQRTVTKSSVFLGSFLGTSLQFWNPSTAPNVVNIVSR